MMSCVECRAGAVNCGVLFIGHTSKAIQIGMNKALIEVYLILYQSRVGTSVFEGFERGEVSRRCKIGWNVAHEESVGGLEERCM